jgi:ribosomal protein L37E
VLEWAGFHKLKTGRIHVYCPSCGRKLSNCHPSEYDPPRATLVHTWCDRCGSGGKDAPEYYFDADGNEIGYEEIEANIEAVIAAKETR